ncbi:CobW family GTP-binding protein [Shewanella sp. YIC-542]|uniref:CobW family GTP-binding protein n=1 Tax=Shewanella mytili TaxID=3377111 RepID=UPI00398ED225
MIISAVPTHVITGFLGAGKTTFIKALLQTKPEAETWAVLVNEFGEIGIDGGLMGNGGQGVVVREVAGGCICCAAGVPLQVAVTQLLAKAKPQRLLIEPTGLGHPLQIMQMLRSDSFAQSLKLLSAVCLLDPRKLADGRYRDNATFLAQLRSADVVLAAKADLWQAQPQVLSALQQFLAEHHPTAPMLPWSRQQSLPSALWRLLQQPHSGKMPAIKQTARLQPAVDYQDDGAPLSAAFDERGIVFRQHQEAQACSYGWQFSPRWVFSLAPLLRWVQAQQVVRLKAVMITADGIAAFNMLDGELTIDELDDAMDSRLELISHEPLDAALMEQQLLACALTEN